MSPSRRCGNKRMLSQLLEVGARHGGGVWQRRVLMISFTKVTNSPSVKHSIKHKEGSRVGSFSGYYNLCSGHRQTLLTCLVSTKRQQSPSLSSFLHPAPSVSVLCYPMFDCLSWVVGAVIIEPWAAISCLHTWLGLWLITINRNTLSRIHLIKINGSANERGTLGCS